MKENQKQFFLFVIGIICLPVTLYKYYTMENLDYIYIIGVLISLWLIYDYYIYKTKNPHILNTIKEKFINKE